MNTLGLINLESIQKDAAGGEDLWNNLSHFQGRRWKTCLRNVMFFSENEISNIPLLLTGAEAKRELLEILCGLRSPIVGETEVMGQFKSFWLDLQKQEPLFAKRIARDIEEVLTSAKKIRSQSLKNLGCQSYGSLVRRLSKNFETVTLLGAGQLAREIFPWLAAQQVQVMARQPLKVLQEWPTVQEVSNLQCPIKGKVLVIAAPLENANLQELVIGKNLELILDLRGDAKLYPEDSERYLSLNGFFKIFENEKSAVKAHYVKAMAEVKQEYLQWLKGIANRPQGWEDLCM